MTNVMVQQGKKAGRGPMLPHKQHRYKETHTDKKDQRMDRDRERQQIWL